MAKDAWAGFADADEWDQFDDAPASKRPVKQKKTGDLAGQILAAQPVVNPTVVDGDTLKTPNLGSLRLWGYDAPELNQPGYKADFSTIPLGQLSRNALQSSLGDQVTFGPSVGQSYGRRVGPLNQGDFDIALQLLRSGQGFAAPQYIDDPERRFDYQAAENLARLNRQGVHEYYMDLPSDFRAPGYRPPERKTVAMFGDTPTPWAGLRTEDANRFLAMAYDPKVPLEDAVAFARSKGGLVSAAEIKKSRDYYLEHGKAGGLNYVKAPAYQLDSGDGATGAGIRGFGSGALMEGLDEAGAVADMLGGTPGRENIWNSDRRWADIWYNNQQQNSAILNYDDENHPYATTTGKVAGGITSGIAIPYGAGARTVPQLAKVGAAYGFGEGFLGTDGSIAERTIGGLQTGPVGAGLSVVGGKALQYAAPKLAEGYGKAKAALGWGADSKAAQNASEAVEQGSEAYGEEKLGDAWDHFEDAPVSRSIAMDAEAMPSLSARVPDYLNMGPVRPGRLGDPLSDAQRRAAAQDIRPQDVLPIAGNLVEGAEDAAGAQAGRFAEAHVPNERGLLDSGSVNNWRGEAVPKIGPTDLVGWARLQGGLRDTGGDLNAIGMNNAARRGMDFVGQEARFGPLVSDEGMNLDDAALAAWEAGYFPELSERPTINQFLDALGETYNGGSGRRFRADDMPTIERYYGQQGERYALEQQRFEQGGPIYQDRSMPADEAAPFPPVEAYEDWPAGFAGKIGNIDVGKLDTPQDIARALKTSHNAMGGFDAATRGRITQAETERLASDLNMTPEQLLSRRKGQAFNAEEALAARRILAKSGNELVNAAKRISKLDDPGDELLAEFRHKWTRHVAIQEQVAGMTAEAGRVLQSFRMAADSREVRGEVLAGLVRAGGGKDDLKEAADALIEAAEVSPGVFNALAEKATKAKWKDKINEFYINALLSNPPTHVVNTVSNTLTSMLQIPEYATGAAIGAIRRGIVGNEASERILASEVGARTFGLIQGAKEGASLFARALRTGEADDFVSKVEGEEFKAIRGIKGEIIRIPTRLLTAEDQFFKGVARRMELNAQALRIASREGLKGEALSKRVAELVADPTDAMLEQAFEYGRYLTFQRKLGDFGQSISRAANSNVPTKIIVPFVRTPINLLKFATERSPAAPLLKEWRKDFLAGGSRRDMAIAKMMLGTGFATLIYQAAQEGKITGNVPPDPAKARAMYADGWQPYSVRIGDRYVSYSRLDPLSTTIGVAADMATLPDGLSDRQKDDKATMLVASIMGNLASKTWLSGMSSFVEGLSDPGRYAGNWLERTASSIAVPAGVAGVARAIDPVSRKRDSVSDAIQARIPGMTQDLLPRRDVFGEIIKNDSLGPDIVSPFWQSEAKNDPVIAEMMRIGKSLTAPGKQYTEDGERVDYSPEDYDRYHEIAGRLSYNALSELIDSSGWQQMTDTQRRKAATKAVAAARKVARGQIGNPDYRLPEKRGGQSVQTALSNEWDAFDDAPPAAERDPWAAFNDAPQQDIVGTLQTAIPGVRFTSGYRTPEYQEDMRRRGYKPAYNSGHLDGSALDMLPPPGKSFDWLTKKVRQQYPDARLLVHDGHLHATFPDWNGAPVFGGARDAGVINPARGR